MAISRRRFLTALAGTTLLVPVTGLAIPVANGAGRTRYLSARGDLDGRYRLTGLDETGAVRFDVPLPGRGHGMALHPNGKHAVAFARRPGHFLLVLDVESGQTLYRLDSASGRNFYGHGVFSADGRWLYTTENDFDGRRGVIGVRDTRDGYRQVGELSAHGIGPHDINLCSDGRTLVIANGGILTHPDTGRAKLNLDTMSPALVYLDGESGKLLAEHKLPAQLHQNSIRHLAITANDTVCIGLQYQGPSDDRPALVGLHRPGRDIQLLSAPPEILGRMRNYCGSVCADVSGSVFAVSSPRGGLVTFWSAQSGDFIGRTDVADGCGIASSRRPGEFLLSSGLGEIYRYRVADGAKTPVDGVLGLGARWDNHMLAVGA